MLATTAIVSSWAWGAEGRFMVPVVTGQPDMRVFAGHPGWVDILGKGYGQGTSARIGEDGTFTLPEPDKPVSLIAMFDKIETPPVIVPHWPVKPGQYDVLIPVEYACIPTDDRAKWDDKYMMRGKNFYQLVVPTCTQLYGVSVFDGPKFVEWGNKINVSVYADKPEGEIIMVQEAGEGRSVHVSATHSDRELPRIGWRHGDMPVEPGRKYAVRAGAYTHGGDHFRLDAYIRPDKGDGYSHGNVEVDGQPVQGDLCCLIFGNSHGQLVENHVRSEEWELFIPPHRPTRSWAQSFVSHGVSLAGISFWAGTAKTDKKIKCEVMVRPDGEWEEPIKPVKVAVGHDSPLRPIIRYPEWPSQVEGCEEYYKLPSKLFQVAYSPDELKLEPNRTYYIDVVASEPIMMYADGDYYAGGYAYYEGLQVDRLAGGGKRTFHSNRWTLAMNIVTYANEGGKPLTTEP